MIYIFAIMIPFVISSCCKDPEEIAIINFDFKNFDVESFDTVRVIKTIKGQINNPIDTSLYTTSSNINAEKKIMSLLLKDGSNDFILEIDSPFTRHEITNISISKKKWMQ